MAKYAEIVFRQRIRFAALLLIAIALSASIAVLFASYRASATLRIEDPSAFGSSFLPIGWSPSQTPAQNLADSLFQVMRTPAFSRSLTNRLTSSGTVSSPTELQQAVAQAGANMKASVSGSHLLTLIYVCPRAAVCLSVLSATIAIFNEEQAQLQQDQVSAADTFWSGQLRDAQANLSAAQTALQKYAAANPSATIDSSSSDPQAGALFNSVELWRSKVVEAQDSLNQAQYLATASARFLHVGTTLVDPPQISGSRFVGDRTSLIPAALVLLVGLLAVGLYIIGLGWADKTAGDPVALERALGVPVVATIPRLVSSGGV